MIQDNVAFISLGSNIEDRYQHLKEAIHKLGETEGTFVEKTSSVYETAPVGYTDQAPFLNMVVKIRTTLSALDLLKKTQKIEHSGGRTKTFRWGPRVIDLDILLYNNENIKLEQLEVPHPRMFERGFVLIPFQEIEPNYIFSNRIAVETYIEQLEKKEGVHKWKNSYGDGESVHSES